MWTQRVSLVLAKKTSTHRSSLIWVHTVAIEVSKTFQQTRKADDFVAIGALALYAPITTEVVCFSRLLKCLRSLYGKQCGPRSDCSYRSSLFWVHAVCFYTLFVSNARKLFAADDISRPQFQMHFFLGALRVKG